MGERRKRGSASPSRKIDKVGLGGKKRRNRNAIKAQAYQTLVRDEGLNKKVRKIREHALRSEEIDERLEELIMSLEEAELPKI